MSDWTSGYVADINYTFGYYAELNPLRIDLAFINAGIRPPKVVNACELGFGQGMSINLHAAASGINWYGTDFNPNQAAFAREVAGVSQSGAQLFDDAFDQFCQRDDLPAFDFIGLHGIWSWISDENRAVVVDFVRRKLNVGGVLFISYNTQPGWAAMVPMRELLVEHSEVMSAPGVGTLARVEDAITFAEKLVELNPRFCQANPQVKGRIEKMRNYNKHYLAHEYFNRDWEPMGFSKMTHWLSSAKMDWTASARYADAIDSIQLSQDQRTLLESISDPMFTQTVRDFCENRQFRTDYWIKGGRRLSHLEKQEALDQLRVIMITPRDQIALKIEGLQGNFDLPESVYCPILNVLDNYQPITIAELRWQLKDDTAAATALTSAITILAAKNIIMPAQRDADIDAAQPATEKLNRWLLNRSRTSQDITFMASPVVAGGVEVALFHQLFLLSIMEGAKTPEDMANTAWGVLSAQNKCLIKDGQSLSGKQDNVAELIQHAERFSKQQLPIYTALKIIPA